MKSVRKRFIEACLNSILLEGLLDWQKIIQNNNELSRLHIFFILLFQIHVTYEYKLSSDNKILICDEKIKPKS